jgi:hypothetical protein
MSQAFITRDNKIALIGRRSSLLHRRIAFKFIFNMIYMIFCSRPKGVNYIGIKLLAAPQASP